MLLSEMKKKNIEINPHLKNYYESKEYSIGKKITKKLILLDLSRDELVKTLGVDINEKIKWKSV